MAIAACILVSRCCFTVCVSDFIFYRLVVFCSLYPFCGNLSLFLVWGVQPLIDRVIEKAKAAAMSIRELLQVLREASSPMLDVQADNLVQVLAASRLLLRFGPLTTGHSMPTQDPSQSLFTASQDAFWAEPVNLRALEEIERAVEERNAFQDMPSFSLGMTQELATQQWDDVVDVARQNDSGVGAGDVARGCPPCAPVAAVSTIVYKRRKTKGAVL